MTFLGDGWDRSQEFGAPAGSIDLQLISDQVGHSFSPTSIYISFMFLAQKINFQILYCASPNLTFVVYFPLNLYIGFYCHLPVYRTAPLKWNSDALLSKKDIKLMSWLRWRTSGKKYHIQILFFCDRRTAVLWWWFISSSSFQGRCIAVLPWQ